MKYPKDWKQTKLKNCSLISGEYGINAAGVPFSENLPKYLRITDIDNSSNVLRLNNMVSVDNTESHKYLLADKDIVFARTGASVGKTYLHNQEKYGELVFAGFLIRFRLDSKILLPEFLYQYCETNEYWNWVKMTSQRSGQPGINSQELGQLALPLPPLKEQQKIAAILSKWDQLIETQTQLINTKEKQKTSLMQKLLTGEVRFPGFEDEWEEHTLGELGEIQTGNTPSKQNEEFWDGSFHWATADDMNGKYISETIQTLSETGYSKARVAKAGSVLVTCIASIGKNAITKIHTGFNQQINSITPNENFDVDFIYYIIDGNRNKLMEFAGAGALPMLNKSTFMGIRFIFPSIKEQQKIASVLSVCDEELQSLKDELEAIKLQKKGLMQQLLTGKIRVKI